MFIVVPALSSTVAQDRREGINASVSQEVAGIFQGKTHSQLVALKNQINERIKSGSAVDIGMCLLFLQFLGLKGIPQWRKKLQCTRFFVILSVKHNNFDRRSFLCEILL